MEWLGGAGYIGSYVNKALSQMGYETVVFDNLVYGHREAVKWGTFVQGDLKNPEEVEAVFQRFPIEAVFHFAAYAYVGESVTDPEKYYFNNVANTFDLLHAMRKHGCDKIISSLTCATYGEPEQMPITEDTGRDFPVICADRRAGDPAEPVGSSEKAKRILGWEPRYAEIDTIVAHAWKWKQRMKDRKEIA